MAIGENEWTFGGEEIAHTDPCAYVDRCAEYTADSAVPLPLVPRVSVNALADLSIPSAREALLRSRQMAGNRRKVFIETNNFGRSGGSYASHGRQPGFRR